MWPVHHSGPAFFSVALPDRSARLSYACTTIDMKINAKRHKFSESFSVLGYNFRKAQWNAVQCF